MLSSNFLTLHGVFLDVFNVGVLVTGKSGVGKSEVGLSLLDKGHALIADDVVEVTREEKDGQLQLIGRCPILLKDFLEVRGLGLLPVRKLFGVNALKDEKPLQLIVEIINGPDPHISDRILGQHSTVEILGTPIAKVGIPVDPGRPLCVLVETAARLFQLTQTGYSPSLEFIERSDSAIATNREFL